LEVFAYLVDEDLLSIEKSVFSTKEICVGADEVLVHAEFVAGGFECL